MFGLRMFRRTDKFFDMFNEAARNIHQGARAFQQMLEDFRGTDEQWRAVEEYEHEGDKITHRILRTLHQTFITPVDREDIHKLTSALDDVIDLIEASAARMAMYRVSKPTPESQRLAEITDKPAPPAAPLTVPTAAPAQAAQVTDEVPVAEDLRQELAAQANETATETAAQPPIVPPVTGAPGNIAESAHSVPPPAATTSPAASPKPA
ncbi:MAG: DUF47 family protein, partial [candidate division NC10 bacterium]